MIQKIFEKKRMLLILSITLFLLLSCFLFPKEEEIILEEPLKEETGKVVQEDVIQVDIKGAVKTPGVYQMNNNSRVQDAIEKSGGLLENAYLNTINLSKRLHDEMVIIIYTKEEIDQFLKEETRTLKQENTCICPKITNDVCIEKSITNKEEINHTLKISLNQGKKEDFETLTGIGPSKAEAIIKYRNEHGKFETIEEIKNVNGIGEATFEKIKDHLTL